MNFKLTMEKNNRHSTGKIKISKSTLAYIMLALTTINIWGCGTLGGFDNITFPVTKATLVNAIDTLFARNPKYLIPEKWKQYDNWNAKGYGYLDTRIFYFNSDPEEMYYVSFVGEYDSIHKNTKEVIIAIRAVFKVDSNWMLEENIKKSEKQRIIKRFNDEIVSKLEEYTNTKSN
jgi:hypothetical protein